jgi:hypothetical protein
MANSSTILQRLACPKLNDLARRLTGWRATRPPGQRIPQELWRAAAKLARTYTVSSVANALSLSYVDLRRRVQGPTGKAPVAELPGFVQLMPPQPLVPAPAPASLELIHPCGARLLVRLDRPTARQVLPWLQTFLRHRP